VGDGFLIRDLPACDRPRERLSELGADALRNAELLAILLRTGMKGVSAIQVAEQLLQKFGSLDALSRASLEELCQVKGVGRDKAIALKSAFTLAKRLAHELLGNAPILDTPERIANYLREDIRTYTEEHFHVLLLNTKARLIRNEEISQGTLNSISVHPRQVFRPAIASNAASVVIVHNHPSGDPTPSDADIKVTRDLIRAGDLLKISVLDHVIMGSARTGNPKDFVSLRELGYFYT